MHARGSWTSSGLHRSSTWVTWFMVGRPRSSASAGARSLYAIQPRVHFQFLPHESLPFPLRQRLSSSAEMAQTTLFGTLHLAGKGRFFSNTKLTDRTDTDDYYSVIEALWTLDNSGQSRKTFFSNAQDQWKRTYSGDQAAQKRLLEDAESSRKGTKEPLYSLIVHRTTEIDWLSSIFSEFQSWGVGEWGKKTLEVSRIEIKYR